MGRQTHAAKQTMGKVRQGEAEMANGATVVQVLVERQVMGTVRSALGQGLRSRATRPRVARASEVRRLRRPSGEPTT